MSDYVYLDELVTRDGLYYKKFTNVPFTGSAVGLSRSAVGEVQGQISKGKREGEWLFYDEGGQLEEIINYKAGKREGVSLGYYENGQLARKGNFKDGKEEGETLYYDEKGQLEKTEIWKDDKVIETIDH